MISLQPAEQFIISRQLDDASDVAVYYVRSVIRDAKTDEILATVNLDSKGSQRYAKAWQVASDGSGHGRYITITTSVYSDAGYTTLAGYSTVIETYLIQERFNSKLFGYGSGSADFDYKKLEKLFIDLEAVINAKLEENKNSLWEKVKKYVGDMFSSSGYAKEKEVKSTIEGAFKMVSDNNETILKRAVSELGGQIQELNSIPSQIEKQKSEILDVIERIEMDDKSNLDAFHNDITKRLSRIAQSYDGLGKIIEEVKNEKMKVPTFKVVPEDAQASNPMDERIKSLL